MSQRKAGRPSKADEDARIERRRQWRREQEQRRQTDSRIEQGLVETITWGEAIDRLGDLRAELLVRAVNSPAVQFVLDRTLDVPDGQVDAAQFDAAWHKALCDLLASDLPLDRDIRNAIAGALWRLTHPAQAKRASIHAKIRVIRSALAELERRGEAPADALNQVATGFGHASGEALDKWLKANG